MEASAAEAQERAEAAGQTGGDVHEGGEERGPGVPEEATRDPDSPQTVQESVARAREQLEQGGSLADLAEGGEEEATPDLSLEEPEPDVEAAEEEGEEEPEHPELQIPEEDTLPEAALPEGWEYDANNRLHRKDGSFASLQDHETLRSEFEKGMEAAEETPSEEEPDVEEPSSEESDLVVELPGRQPDETFKIEAADEETAERLRQLSNDAMRRQEFKRQKDSLDEERREFREVTTAFKADPAAFLAEQVEDPEIRKRTVLRLLGENEEVFNEVQSTLRQWDMNPDKKRADLAEMDKEARDRREDTTREERVREAARKGATQARRHIESIVNEAGLRGETAKRFFQDAMQDVGTAMAQAGRFEISQDEARKVLEASGTLEAFGVSPGDSGDRTSSRPGASEGSASDRRVRAVEPDSEAARKARRAGEEMKEEAESRRAAAATPHGAGASAAQQVTPPEGQGVEERIEWLKERGLGAVLSGQ